MFVVIFVSIFLGFSLGFATMALVTARNYRLQCEEAQETSSQIASEPSPMRRFNPLLPAWPQASGASGLLASRLERVGSPQAMQRGPGLALSCQFLSPEHPVPSLASPKFSLD